MVTKDLKNFSTPVFPFTAIVGQEEMKLALQLNVIDPKIGGVMIMGDRGTGKSTTIRAIADLLPEIEVVKNDPFNSHTSDLDLMSNEVKAAVQNGEAIESESIKIPMIDLPLGATEDRVCGTIDIEKALTEGIKAFEPGLLAKANRGLLYVDEVNLLDDHLVDILLDSAASGWNTVEREGISVRHPARFVLVGSGNPEEGELRPQLLDRFGMHAEIRTVKDPALRVKVVEVDGLRGDIVTNRAAKAYAAYNGRTKVTVNDIAKIITLCLRHRLRKDPLESIDSGDKVSKVFKEVFEIDE